MKATGRLLVVLAVTAGAALLVPAAPAAAHVKPVSISPASGARLAAAPVAVVVRFDDEIDPEDSMLALFDERGDVVASGGIDLDLLDHRTMHLSVPELPDGAFAIRWQARGMTDEHVVAGESGFAVGTADAAGALSGNPASPGGPDSSGASNELPVTPWLVAFVVAASFVVVAGLHRRRRSGTSPEELQASSRGP